MKTKAAVVSLVLLLATAVVAQSTEDRQMLAQARQAYYSLRTQGVSSFQCEIVPDWNLLLQDQRQADPAAADAAIKILNQLHFILHFGAGGKSSITHNELSGQTPEMNKALAQIYGGMEQMTSGFFDTWSLFMFNDPFPAVDNQFQLTPVGQLYTLHYLEGTADIVTVMSKDFAISQLAVASPTFHSTMHPIFSKSGSGFLLSGYDADYDSGKPEELTHLNVLLDYQLASGVQMLQKLDLRGSYGGGKFAVVLSFQGCQVTRK
jgi:hypothetical protein